MEEIRRENDGTTKEKKRSLEDLNVIDDFLMNAAASDREGLHDVSVSESMSGSPGA